MSGVTAWGIGLLYLVALIESAGGPLPYELVFIGVLFLMEQGRILFLPAMFSLLLINLIGNLLGYLLGAKYGRLLVPLMMRRFRATRRVWRQFPRNPRRIILALFVTRWTGVGFGPSLWLTGVRRFALFHFLVFMTLTNVVWILIWLAGGQKIVFWAKNLQVAWLLPISIFFLFFFILRRFLKVDRTS